jgi:hypothetical protein
MVPEGFDNTPRPSASVPVEIWMNAPTDDMTKASEYLKAWWDQDLIRIRQD